MTEDEQHEAYGAMRHAMTQHVSHRASDEIAHLRAEVERLTRERDKWKSRENETQEALQSVGNRFGFLGGEPRTSAVERVLSELEARAEAAERERDEARGAAERFRASMYALEEAVITSGQERVTAERQVATLREALKSYACDCDTSFPGGITECNGYFDAMYCGKRAREAIAKAKS